MDTPPSSAAGHLSFRRQFLLTPEPVEGVPDWRRHRLGDALLLSAHPDLVYTRADDGDRTLILLGYVLDPRHPERDDLTNLRQILRESTTFAEVLTSFDARAGRWAAIYLGEGRARIFHDAAGMRSVYYARTPEGPVWCASTPGLLTTVSGHREDVEHRTELMRAGVFNRGTNHFWPGSGSPFIGIDRLLPNHCLDLESGVAQRFWPNAPIPPSDPAVAVGQCADILSGILSAAAARSPLSLGVTAGFDSRLLLAASRGITDKLTFHTLKKSGLTALSPDIRVPRAMLGDLGLAHKIITVQRGAVGPVAETIRRTFFPCHEQNADQAAALQADPPRPDGPWVTINGNVSEVARTTATHPALTPANLAAKVDMEKSAYAVKAFTSWLDASMPSIELSGVDPWKLFYWEQKIGGWLAQVRAEFDLVEEGVTPYNSRDLLITMLGVDESLRTEPDFTFYRDMITHLWPELLDYPINPPDRLAPIRRRYRKGRGVLRRSAAKVVPALRRPHD